MGKRKANQRAEKKGGTWLIFVAAVIFVLILLVRLMEFVTPHGQPHF